MRSSRSWLGVVLAFGTIALTQTGSEAAPGTTTANCGSAPCTWVLFGPYIVTRETGEPRTVSASFSTSNPGAAYVLHVTNHQISSADVWVNGVRVLSPADFNPGVTTLDRPIHLSAENTIAAELRSQPGASLAIEVIGVDPDAPIVTYTETPPANSSGWHLTDVQVAFSCSDPTSGIAFCSPAADISNEGQDQPVSGMGRDLAGNTTTVSLAVSVDKTAPAITIGSPAEGSVVPTTTTTVLGTVTDALSGVAADSVSCNGVPAVLSSTAFSCAVTLVPGSNHITVQASDTAGNQASAAVNVTTQTATATQHLRLLDIAPSAIPASAAAFVVVTAQADVDATLLPETVALYRHDPQTQQAARLDRMYDDGTHGDQRRGDNVFTATITVNEPAPSIVFLQVAASYRNLTQPVFSDTLRLFVQATTSAEQALADLAGRLEQNDIAGAAGFFASPKAAEFLSHLNDGQRARLVAMLGSLSLASATGAVRVYRHAWLESDGSTTDVDFGLTQDQLGRWVIFSW